MVLAETDVNATQVSPPGTFGDVFDGFDLKSSDFKSSPVLDRQALRPVSRIKCIAPIRTSRRLAVATDTSKSIA
ncbi:hypothetical protein CKO51_26110 [Rhodopirellula sp. SM50]|nr:hypothetical protein CKO51_26110 [Rhodopirellula sp. SM50]